MALAALTLESFMPALAAALTIGVFIFRAVAIVVSLFHDLRGDTALVKQELKEIKADVLEMKPQVATILVLSTAMSNVENRLNRLENWRDRAEVPKP